MVQQSYQMRWFVGLRWSLVFTLAASILLGACGDSSHDGFPVDNGGGANVSTLWTWVSGSDTVNQSGTYGNKGVPDAANVPGARLESVSWIDSSGNLWLFGGDASLTAIPPGFLLLNDLWKFDGTNWTWISGRNTGNQYGTYGTKGVPGVFNMPGARGWSVSWIDRSGNLWLFGGQGYGIATLGGLNDLWKFDGNNWTWVSGSNSTNQISTYGTKGLPDAANVPGARRDAVSWIDSSGSLWLFGGAGYGPTVDDDRNDLWKFDGANWTWISGSNLANQSGTYGTKGIADATNIPGGRSQSVSWIDGSGNFWLFGGFGFDSVGARGDLNDLWKFDGANWTWVSGSNLANQSGNYGTKGGTDPANVPSARCCSVGWIDTNGNMWLFGGFGAGLFNDLWKFDGANWTWISGSNLTNQSGTYGTKGIADATNIPGGRTDSIGWIDQRGDLWLFGGSGYDSAGSPGDLNDLWRYRP